MPIYSNSKPDKWTTAFSEKNPGLAYVRHLEFVDTHSQYHDQKAGRVIRHMLRVLPKDGLQTFQ